MFANFMDNIAIKWESILEWYILKVDSGTERIRVFTSQAQGRFDKISEQHDHPRRLLQLTLFGIIITFTVLLFSCQTAPRMMPPMQTRKFDAARPERELDQLFIKRQELTIRNTETGSSTGSIWADSREPRSLIVDATPSKEGQTITVLIPDDLQFDPKNTTTDGNSGKNKDKAGNKKTAEKEASDQNNSAGGLKLTDPSEASPSQKLALRPIKSFKMQIVGFEPAGDVYLRGIRKYTGLNGQENTTMVLAKVPRRLLNGFELDARELTDVAVNEDLGGQVREYSAPGWDEMVSRRLAGFTPDLNSELASLDALRDEIKTTQASLRDQAKANEMERERIRKERSRMSGQPSQSNSPAAAPSTTAQTPAADKKEGAKE